MDGRTDGPVKWRTALATDDDFLIGPQSAYKWRAFSFSFPSPASSISQLVTLSLFSSLSEAVVLDLVLQEGANRFCASSSHAAKVIRGVCIEGIRPSSCTSSTSNGEKLKVILGHSVTHSLTALSVNVVSPFVLLLWVLYSLRYYHQDGDCPGEMTVVPQ